MDAKPDNSEVLQELERVLKGRAFRTSQRSQEFLRFIVGETLAGRGDSLKERSIGVEVFKRKVDYETAEDSIVRVKASEVRKRLAQYYMESGGDSTLRICLETGSYVPEFRQWKPTAPPPVQPADPGRQKTWIWAAVALILVAAVYLALRPAEVSVLDRFWRPVVESPHPVLVCVPNPTVYRLTGRAREAAADRNTWDDASPLIPLADVLRDKEHYVGVGDALSAAAFSAYFGRVGKVSRLRVGASTSFADLRENPSVLIGAFSNQWTMEVTSDLRFVFESGGGEVYVRDRMDEARRWRNTSSLTDYAVISRVRDSRTGEVIVAAAGLSHLGTQVAGEFLTNENYLAEAVGTAPADWEAKNLQFVLRSEVVDGTAGPPEVLAGHYW
jgi:hypothetical protein